MNTLSITAVISTVMFAAPLQSAELVKNPGMEEGDVEWTNWTAHKIVSSPVQSGYKSLEYTHHNWNAAAQNNIRVSADNEYTISLWSKAGDGMKGPAAKYFFFNDKDKVISTGFIGKHQSNNKWVQHKTKIKAPEGTIKLSLKLIGSNFKADLWFDDVSIARSKELPGNPQVDPPKDNNLVKNSSMESGDINWGKWTAHQIVSSPVHSGSKSLRYSNSNWIAGSQNGIPVSAGLDYKISFWSKAGPGMSGRAGKYYFKDINNKVISHGFIGVHQANNQWINHTLDIKAPKNSNKMNLRLFGNNLDADLWFDDIEVIASNQPSPTSNSKEPPIAGDWTMTFDEEFTGNALDPTKWKMGEHHLGTLGKAGLNKDSITFKNGALTLTAEKKPIVFGSKYYNYSSGTISTFRRFKQKYGYYETRIRYDATLGAWPAFWLMPDHGKEYYGDPEHHKESFIRFDLNKSSPVTKAILKLKVSDIAKETVDNPQNPVIYNLSIHKLLSNNWSEKTINWNNKPSYDPVWLIQLSGTKDSTVNNQLYLGKELNIDVTQYVNERIRQHQKNIGFALVDTFRKDKRISISSKETANINNRPKLVIDEQTTYPSDDTYVRSGSHAGKTFGELPTLDLRNPWQGKVAARYDGGAEIDIFESQGIWKNSLHHALHWFKSKSDTERQSIHSNRVALDSPTNEYHTYGAHWEPGRIRFYVDGRLTATFKNQNVPIISGYIILSHWFGGWIVSGNTAIDDDKLPATMQVDYVRVWSGQAANSPNQDDQ